MSCRCLVSLLALAALLAVPARAPAEDPPTERPLRVLLFAGGPTREYQFVRTLFASEAGRRRAELSICLQKSAKAAGVVQDVPSERLLDDFPAVYEPDEKREKPGARYANLARYDVIIAFDPDWARLGAEQLALLEKWVGTHGRGLIVVGGPVHTLQLAKPHAAEGKLRPILDLYPVVLEDSRLLELERQAADPWRLHFPGAAPEMKFLHLDESVKESLSGWEEFFTGQPAGKAPPGAATVRGIYTYYPVKLVKAGAVVIATYADPQAKIPDDRGRQKEQPYLVSRLHGKGRVVYLSSGEMWRLRQFRADYHNRFWTELARYAAFDRPKAPEPRPAAPKDDRADRPNVVLIVADDLGWADLGCYGSAFHRTPHLDRLAAGGLRWTDAYAACPVCSPTRAALLTGRYPARLNLTDWLPGRPDRPDQKLRRPAILDHLPAEAATLAEVLRAEGYATGHVGKWHLGGPGHDPQRRGFDVNIGGDQSGSPPRYFAPFKSNTGRFMPGLEDAPEGEYLTDRLTAEAEKFIEQNKDRPFFLYLAHYAVHIPLQPRPDKAAKYQAGGAPGTQNNPLYAAMLESLDDSVGRVLQRLDELKLAERTLVLFTSDNGGLSVAEGPNTPATSNTPLREGKGYLYEGGIRVPLIAYWPGVVKPGTVTAAAVSSIDLFPTVVEVCAARHAGQLDGVSLASLLRGGAAPRRDALFWHYPHYSNQGGRPGAAVRAGDFKLIEFYEQDRRELYNLKKDPGETNNLIEVLPDVARDLQTKLDAWRTVVGARMMKPNPYFIPNPQAADGTITLPARTAEVHGVQLRYEPAPHKNTLGFWTRADDWAGWEFTVQKPGAFTLEVLQGCGKGEGGSEVELAVAGQALRLVVEDTGHFQNFKPRALGTVTLDKPGRYTLTVKARMKAGVAVMDLRAVTLRPAGK